MSDSVPPHTDAMLLEPGGTLSIDNSEGPVYLWVRSRLDIAGNLVRAAEEHNVLWGFEGTITALGAVPGDLPPTLIATVVRFDSFLKSSGETQIIMTTGE